MYNVQCTMYTCTCTMYTCTMYNVHMYNVHSVNSEQGCGNSDQGCGNIFTTLVLLLIYFVYDTVSNLPDIH